MKTVFTTAIILITAFTVLAQGNSILPNTKGAQRVLAYFNAFNSNDEQKLRSFFTENITEESLKQRAVEPRMEFHKQVKSNFQTIEIQSLVSATGTEIKLLARSVNGGWISYIFTIEDHPAQKIVGLTIEPVDPPVTETRAAAYPAPTTSAEFLKTAEKYLIDLAKTDAFSGVVLVAKDDKPVFSRAYGLASKEYASPNRPDTKFNLGSINKIFTRVAIGQLVQQGKISFDDKLGKYLPDYPNRDAAEKVTIRHLITMKSGIGDFFGEKFDSASKDRFRNNADLIPLFADQPLAFEPGTKDQYSNGGYILLGAIIEKVSGKSYYDYVRDNIFKPAGMADTDSYESEKMPPNTASGYTTHRAGGGSRVNNVFTRPARGSAAGGGYSTAEDLLKFSIALKTGKLTTPDDNGQPRKDASLGIAGGSDGINAVFMVNAQSGYTVIVLSNYDPPAAEQSGKQLRDWLKQIQQ
jgi:CubicO group peptidase (beta-lactamase class C family)